jgi:C4-type Zn-finger protein
MPWARADYTVICKRCGSWEQAAESMSLFTIRKVKYKQRVKRPDEYYLRYEYRCNNCGFHQMDVRHEAYDPWPVAREKRLKLYEDAVEKGKPLFKERKENEEVINHL